MKIAIIDIGTNSLKLKLFSLEEDNVPHALHEFREIIQLGEHAYISGKISASKELLLLTVLTRFKKIAETWRVDKIYAYGTSILREATNGPMIIETIKNRLGIDIQIISGEEEAHYIYLAVKSECLLPAKEPVVIVDIGGGSAECIIANSEQVLACVSLPLGALRLHDIFVHHHRLSSAELGLLENYIQRAFSPFLEEIQKHAVGKVLFTGGTATALLKITKETTKATAKNSEKGTTKSAFKAFKGALKGTAKNIKNLKNAKNGSGNDSSANYKSSKGSKDKDLTKKESKNQIRTVSGTQTYSPASGPSSSAFLPIVKLKELENCLEIANLHTPEEHALKYKMDVARSRILLPGLMVIKVVINALKKNQAYIARSGLRDGLFQSLLQPHQSEDNNDWERFVDILLRKYRCDIPHSNQVSRLALAIFDQLPEIQHLGGHGRKLLHLAGLLHDIGQFVNYSSHHKHSFYILNNITILGISGHDRHLIAHIARYHRKALPSNRHQEFAELPEEEAQLVRKLSAILRIADALDRGHNSPVKNLKLLNADESGRKHLEIEVDVGDRDFSLEEWAVAKKSDLFKLVFKQDVKILKLGHHHQSAEAD
jgi:exopolyphosphatase/pppGpp-phosphohydrolase